MGNRKIDRTTRGLRKVCFDEMEKLINGESSPQQARAVSSLGGVIINTARIDLDYMRAQNYANADSNSLPKLDL